MGLKAVANNGGASGIISSLGSAGLNGPTLVVASNLNALHNLSRNVANQSIGAAAEMNTFRTEHFIAQAIPSATDIQVVFGNHFYGNSGGQANQNYIAVEAALEIPPNPTSNAQTNPRIKFSFEGKNRGYIAGGGLLFADPIPLSLVANQRFFIRTGVTVGEINNPPAAPTLTPSITGGQIASGTTYYFVITYVTPQFETFCSTATSTTIASGTTGSIAVTSPATGNGTTGYRIYASTLASGPWYAMSGAIPIGQNYTILQQPAATGNAGIDNVSPNSVMGFPQGFETLGGSSFFGINNGEGRNNGISCVGDTPSGQITSDLTAVCYSPVAILGKNISATSTNPVPSVFSVGDSINWGQADDGWRVLGSGGYITRGLMGATTLSFQSGLVPRYGFATSGIPGERFSQFLQPSIQRGRYALSRLFSNWICQYGINDVTAGTALSTIQIYSMQVGAIAYAQGQKYFQNTLFPRTTSTDGFQTVANQTGNLTGETVRQEFNSFVRSTATSGTVITGETPSGSVNGSNKIFLFSQAFIVGTETITDNGGAAGAYNYNNIATINGVSYADGVAFVTAPTNGHALLTSYTSAPGHTAIYGSANAGFFDPCVYVEVNSSGVFTLNGGFWAPANMTGSLTGTTSATSASSLTDATAPFTTTTPTVRTLVGWNMLTNNFCATIAYASSTSVLTSQTGFFLCNNPNGSANPGSGAAYLIYRSYTIDGVHPSSYGAQQASQCINLSALR